MSDDQLAAIRKRCEAATVGPWKWCPPATKWNPGHLLCQDLRENPRIPEELLLMTSAKKAEGLGRGNQQFIAHARQDVPDLLDEVERLRRLEDSVIRQQTNGAEYRRALVDERNQLRVTNAALLAACEAAEGFLKAKGHSEHDPLVRGLIRAAIAKEKEKI